MDNKLLEEIESDILCGITAITSRVKKNSISSEVAKTLNELIEAYEKINHLNTGKIECQKTIYWGDLVIILKKISSTTFHVSVSNCRTYHPIFSCDVVDKHEKRFYKVTNQRVYSSEQSAIDYQSILLQFVNGGYLDNLEIQNF